MPRIAYRIPREPQPLDLWTGLALVALLAAIALQHCGCASVGQLEAHRDETGAVDATAQIVASPVGTIGILVEGDTVTVCVAAPGERPVCEAVQME